MSDVMKQEGIRLIFSLFFFCMVMVIMWYTLPKITERAGVSQAKGFWRNEVFQNRKRLFGNGDEDDANGSV